MRTSFLAEQRRIVAKFLGRCPRLGWRRGVAPQFCPAPRRTTPDRGQSGATDGFGGRVGNAARRRPRHRHEPPLRPRHPTDRLQRQRRTPSQPRATPWENAHQILQGLKARSIVMPQPSTNHRPQHTDGSRFQRSGFLYAVTWGVAPGWHGPGRWPFARRAHASY